MKKRFTKPAPFWTSWGSAKSTQQTLPLDALDRAGAFETLRVYSGRVAGADAHVRRLRASAQTIGIRVPSEKILTQKIEEAVKRSGLSDAIARLSIHAASGSGTAGSQAGSGLQKRSVPHFAAGWIGCSVRPFTGCPENWYRSGVRILTASVRRPGPSAWAPQVKGNDYMNALGAILNGSATRVRGGRGPGRTESRTGEEKLRPVERLPETDPMILAASGAVSETTVANLFILREGALWTPSAACGILLGVTRAAVLESAQAAGLRVLEKPFTRHDLYNADEVFLTNAAIEVLPVVEADARRIGNGRPGPWARCLRDAYRKRVLPDFF